MNHTKEEMLEIINWLTSSDVGASSKSIVVHMMNLRCMETNHPHDIWDRERCIKLLKLIPKWQKRLDEMKIYQGWKEQIPLIKQELN